MAETEVSKEVSETVAIEEKCGLDMSSYEDLPKPDCNGNNQHNQAHDLDNSYVFVTGADGLPDDAVYNKDVEAEGSSILPESEATGFKYQEAELDSQNEKLDAVSGDFQPLNEAENGNVEQSNGDPSLVNGSTSKSGSSHEDGEVIKISVADREFLPLNEADNRNVELSNGDPNLVESKTSKHKSSRDDGEVVKVSVADREFQPLNEADNVKVELSNGVPNLVESSTSKHEGSHEDGEVIQVSVADGELQPLNEAHNGNVEQSNVDPNLVERSTSKHESSHEDGEVIKVSVVDGEFRPMNEVENRNVEQSNEDPKSVEGGTSKHESSYEDGEVIKVSAVDGEFWPLKEAENRNVEQSNEDPNLVEGGTLKHESSYEDAEVVQVSIADSLEEHTEKTESTTEAEVKQVEDPDGRIESLAESEAEKSVDQNGVVEGEQENYDNVIKPEYPSGPVENQESQVRALALVAESGENGELNNILLHNSSSHSASDECDHQSNLSVSESLEACQGSQDAVADVIECESRDVRMEAEDKVKSAREVAETAEHEVSQTTSMDSGLESHPVHSKNETLEEEANTALSSESHPNECESRDESSEGEAEVKSVREVAEAVEHEVSQATSMDFDLESHPVHSKDETLEEEAKAPLSFEAHPNECETRDESPEGEAEVKSVREVAEAVEHEVSQATSMDFDLESHPVHSKDDILEEEAKPTLCSESYLVECESQDESVKAEAEAKSAREVAEAVELVVSQATSMNFDLELHPVHSKDEVFEVEGKPTLSSESHPVECESRDESMEAEDEVKSVREVAEAAEHEVSQATSKDLDSESHPVHSNEEILEVEAKPTLSSESHPLECDSRDGSMEAEDEVKSVIEVAETAEHEVSQATSKDLDLESHPVHSKDEILEEEVKTTLSSNILEIQQADTAVGNNVQGEESKTLVNSTDCHVQTVCDLVLEEKNVDCWVSEVDNGVQYPEVPDEQTDGSGVSHHTTHLVIKTETSVQTESYPASNVHVPKREIETSDAETVGAVSTSPINGPESQIIEKIFPGHDSGIRSTPNEASFGSDSTLGTEVLTENEPTPQGGGAHADTEVSSGKAEVADSPPATFDAKLEPEVHVFNSSAINSGEKTDDVADSYRTEVSDSFNINKECAASIVSDIEGDEGMGDQVDGAAVSNENLNLQEIEDNGDSHSKEISVASAGGSGENMVDGEAESIKTKTKPFNFLIRIPRFDDENLREEIRLAKLHVDEKTKLRDAIQAQIQEIRANSQIHGIDYEYAKGEGRSARKLVRSKRMEIDSLQAVINKAKNALSVEDIDSQIHNMEHMIQHETLPLKEEKLLIREIKQLKQLREQLSSNMGSQDEIKQALEQREEVEERLKILRKELDILKNKVIKAEAIATEAEKKYDDENKKVKELQAQFRAADDVRQAAYAQLQNLRKELSKKSKHFFKYKDDAALASKYVFSRDTEAVYCLCMKQVENFMQLWNTNDEFRGEYVKFNARSTVRRFGTLDGRSLGPDEKPPLLPSNADERVNRMASTPLKVDLASEIPSPEQKQETTNENVTLDGKSKKKETEPKNQKVTKGHVVTAQTNGLDTLPSIDLIDMVYEEPIKSKEQLESTRKEEEMRREEAEAKLKEQRRLEALAKANEARERKKRQAEKLQLRAELKTQKEAEQREKEREKRLRKKERKKAAGTDANDSNNNSETAPSSESAAENSKDIEVKDTPSVAPKKSQKPWLSTKQTKAKSIPPPLRNRNKKKLQQWLWVGITSLMILVLFWLGNMGVFSNVAIRRRPVI